ncbi:histone-lysine N-methyltransferase, H3 lysine-9 specific SUVH5-like [Magnolia sinica]|uniref:histone-lysine N-methyltransferase, H3 lysine-9 specific SUVH5-like n=1 Tax=Magnolia sinica TaxID=86752 RepID=UPI0026599722|nr:histone-lysine N-methyltransferase, H3 lysine-9 specific SUVH5-like [Magnolia sinica]XP_058104084.1 histone-lysine N-methyltransferase, H3 lysine-9 specific SUVH5-like [Magnolia sinica]XP_058104085.1 histone-lysine N-methyltransferase, H3 lysine-9 specific SUVH5-like [Magnolia sinica]XP_058104086.1 histone-lysine N-methyltransferase, H3 lysine-9 specific SUVH5-like [Magnolia sinica]XP_058104087.1 histone-lysine N-methyltransferase, H3 lysine-9 specific SUVH5-like [Magnolia sinica]XP_0581040
MAGVESPSLRNGNAATKSLKKRDLEDGISSVDTANCKRQKVSAIRDFPSSCGRFAARIKEKITQLGAVIGAFVGPTESLESSNHLDQTEVSGSSQILKGETAEFPMILDQTKLNGSLLETPKREISLCLPQDSVQPDTCESSKVSDQHCLSVSAVEETEEHVAKRYPLRRRISSSRDFPQGCGRKARRMSKEERLKVIASSGSKSGSNNNYAGDDGPSLKMARTVNTGRNGVNSRMEDTKEVTTITAIQEVVSWQEKLVEESAGPSKDKSSNRKFMGEEKNVTENRSQGDGFTCFESFGDRMMVQAPVGAANHPWGQGKLQLHATSVSYGMAIDTFKKDGGDLSWKSKASRGKMAARKSHCMEKTASQERNKKDIKDEDNSLPPDECVPVAQESQEIRMNVVPSVPPNSSAKGHDARHKVRETLRLFQATFRRLLRGEEAKRGQGKAIRRIDLAASKLLKEANKCVNTGKPIFGSVPGVEIGDEFRYRVELSIIGLHRPYQGGIDYTKVRGRILATSVVASGGYADDMDDVDVLVYSGQGGIPSCRDKLPKDQKLERGNLALKNSIDAKRPVRVIRGYKETKGSDSHDAWAKTGITFTYYGLYWVERFWQEDGDHGFKVFKFELRRMPGQPDLALKEAKKSKRSAVREGLCLDDISNGGERIPICAVNTIDSQHPLPFKYRTKMVYPSWCQPTLSKGCDCTNGCSDKEKCICVIKNGGEIPFNHDGAIVEAKPLVYECGPSCKCPPSCYNRVSQHGIRFLLEIFKTKSRGWGVRSLNSIPSGSFVCEYTGELLDEKEAEQRTGNDEYLFDIGRNYNDHSLIPNLHPAASCEVASDSGFTIDAAEYGSVGRFINHSCSPNLYTQNVLYDHNDKRIPHIMLFAAENIPPLQELTYDYNYTIGQVQDSDGNVKEKICYCGSNECSGRLY